MKVAEVEESKEEVTAASVEVVEDAVDEDATTQATN